MGCITPHNLTDDCSLLPTMRDKPIDSIWMDGSLKPPIKHSCTHENGCHAVDRCHKLQWIICCGCSACKVNDATITVLLKELILILYNPRIKMLQTKFTGEISSVRN
ncbi:hypothetical protein CHUAL_000049 [Chamberlinius hualienensis]